MLGALTVGSTALGFAEDAAGFLGGIFGGGSDFPPGGWPVGQAPGQPDPNVLGAALANGPPAAVAAVRAVVERYAGQWEKGYTVQQIMSQPAVLGWLGWGGGNGAVRGDGEKQLQSAIRALLASVGNALPAGGSSSTLGRVWDNVQDEVRELPGNIATAAIDQIGQSVGDAARPAAQQIAGQRLLDSLPMMIVGGVVTWLILRNVG